jgi:tripartite-type tricarboxylate transporter receptor subunit TctC
VVDNRGSGGGVIASQMVANAPPDGYTLFLATGAGMVSAPLAMSSVGYDPYKDFSPVGMAALLPAFLRHRRRCQAVRCGRDYPRAAVPAN